MGMFRRHNRADVDVESMLANLDRLAAVAQSGLMDAPPSPGLDRLTQDAAARLGAPIALMSILDDDRVFYASQVGLSGPPAVLRQESAHGTYCKLVVATQDVVAIDDAQTDELVSDHPAKLAGRARSYLGVPLRQNGQTLGSFCVADHKSRVWTEDDVKVLEELAAIAMSPVHHS